MNVSMTGRLAGDMGSKGTLFLILVLVVIQLTGCATPASIEGMTVSGTMVTTTAPANFALKDSLLIDNVSGGQTTNPLWTSEVGGEEFRAALEESLSVGKFLAHSDNDALYLIYSRLLCSPCNSRYSASTSQ